MASPETNNRLPRRRGPFSRPLSPLWFGAVFFGLLLLVQATFSLFGQGETLEYSQFKSLLDQGRIVEVRVGTNDLNGAYLDGDNTQKRFTTVRVEDPNLADQLSAKKVKYAGERQNPWVGELLSWVFPILLIV